MRKFSLRKRLQSFSYAWNGIRILFSEEHNSRIHVVAAVAVNVAGYWAKISPIEWAAIWICIGLVFATELINSALENLCDHISPEENERIGVVKDLAAAAVLIASAVSVIVGFFTIQSGMR